ncbi:hypothetical protein [Bacillus kexueae]|uniref:hypothetical protein n=1 Tax=Aeribacillus kexueae TaxID=2078952 RepID=UPI001FAEE0A6|nr:hypothetical protein [Bacillus kexueae]
MDNVVFENFIISLLAKPFVILTGNSGTGKTRLALNLAEYLEGRENHDDSCFAIEINEKGLILHKSEEEIRNLCVDSNEFEAKVGDKFFKVRIEMNVHVKCEDDEFWEFVKSGLTKIRLGNVSFPREKRHVLVPVGADWTDSRNLLGFVNPFGQDGKTVYQITPMVELILMALHPDNHYLPHFVILDEMNLSHVERYFSKFLSAMEANRSTSVDKGITLIDKNHLPVIVDTLRENSLVNPKVLESAEILLENNDYISLPPNLFIVGTVNVDETTYMFSPKVLDRAHIIELETIHPLKFFREQSRQKYTLPDVGTVLNQFKFSIIYRKQEQHGINPLSNLKSVWQDELTYNEAKKQIEQLLSGVYNILKISNFDFGYRILKETIEYLYFSILYNNSCERWFEYLDNILLQKILPKLHGNRRQIDDVLDLLIKFLNKEEFESPHVNIKVKEESTGYPANIERDIIRNKLDFPKSIAKLQKMRSKLNSIGYTSFIS